jgi:hypothetical protein
MNSGEATQMASVERLQQVERFGAAYFADQNAIWAVAQRGAKEIRNGDRRQGRFLPERRLGATRFES